LLLLLLLLPWRVWVTGILWGAGVVPVTIKTVAIIVIVIVIVYVAIITTRLIIIITVTTIHI
jgi:hypothetical protein